MSPHRRGREVAESRSSACRQGRNTYRKAFSRSSAEAASGARPRRGSESRFACPPQKGCAAAPGDDRPAEGQCVQDRTFSRRQALRAGAFTLAGGAPVARRHVGRARPVEGDRLGRNAPPGCSTPPAAGARAGPGSSTPRILMRSGAAVARPATRASGTRRTSSSVAPTPPTRAVARTRAASAPSSTVRCSPARCSTRSSSTATRVTAVILGSPRSSPAERSTRSPVPMIAGIAAPVVLVAAGGIGYAIWRRNQRRLDSRDRHRVGRVHRTATNRTVSLA